MASPITSSGQAIASTGERLRRAMSGMIEAMPNVQRKPTPLASCLGISRVTVSNLLNALACKSGEEVLLGIPGPESLRVMVEGAERHGAPAEVVAEASASIDAFAALVREQYGTRSALAAAIGGKTAHLTARVDTSARADVFRGMRRVLGVEAQVWLTSMLFQPAKEDPTKLSVTTLHGALGLRRLRGDTEVYFTIGAPYKVEGASDANDEGGVRLDDLSTNGIANIEVSTQGGQLRHRLVHEHVGKDAVVDMLAVSHKPLASSRYSAPGAPLRGASIFVDTPAQKLVADVLLHPDVFPQGHAKLLVFNTGAHGPANPNDPARAPDRVPAHAQPWFVTGKDRFEVDSVPHLGTMVERVCRSHGLAPEDLRVWRVEVEYPLVGFQYVIAFEAPTA